MRLAPLALVLALGLTTASAQPTVDGDLTDAPYVLLDDNSGGPVTGFGVGLSELNALYAHVDVPSSTLYLGVAGTVEANFNKLLIFLDTREGGYADGNYGATGGLSGVDGFNPDNQFDDGFRADFVLSVTRGGDPVEIYASLVELAGDRPTGASIDRYVTGPGSAASVDIALIPAPDGSTYDVGYEIAIPFSAAVASDATPLVVSGTSLAAFPLVASGDGTFLSNLTLSPAASDQDNYGADAVDFGALTGAGGASVSDPVAYAWYRADVAGWRQYAWPVPGATVAALDAQNHVQGVPGTAVPQGGTNLYGYGAQPGGPDYVPFASASEPLGRAQGFFWYHYDSAPSTSFVPLPFTLQAGGLEALEGVSVEPGYAPPADGSTVASYLLGNPFAADFDLGTSPDGMGGVVEHVAETAGYTVSNSVFIWDPAVGMTGGQAGSYRELMRDAVDPADRTLRPFEGAWVELTDPSAGTLGAPTIELRSAGRTRLGALGATRLVTPRTQVAFELDLLDGDAALLVDRTTRIAFAEGASAGLDVADASEPPAIEGQEVRLGLVGAGGLYRAVESREAAPEGPVAVRLALRTPGMGAQTYRLRWDASTLPAGWAASLRDLETGQSVDLRAAAELVLAAPEFADWTDRFELTVTPSSAVAGEEAPQTAEVLAPRPNPSAGAATMRVQVDRPQTVRVEAFDLLGRRVAVLFDGSIETARAVAVDASALAPGLYVLRATGETFAAAHRFTVAR